MSIGKNAIKRVENNGYTNVVTSAPDMENSVVKPAAESESPEKSAKKVIHRRALQRDGFVRVAIGEEMPIWLL